MVVMDDDDADDVLTQARTRPEALATQPIEPLFIFNSGAYGGGDCSKSDCNGITMNGGSLSMTGVVVRNNQVRVV